LLKDAEARRKILKIGQKREPREEEARLVELEE
jgi:hypothetical protein